MSSRLRGIAREVLGSGGQGEVYAVDVDGSPEGAFALKWYFGPYASFEQRRRIERLVALGRPDARFLWPLDIATASPTAGFGYLMARREARFASMAELMRGTGGESFRTTAIMGAELADAFLKLHAQGLCYRDISFGNVFADTATGAIAVCDNDNVGVDRTTDSSIRGTLPFMAPELVRNEVVPSSLTDLHSLAVLLFFLLVRHHPLEGRAEFEIECFDTEAKIRLYGVEPVFVFDPDNSSNRPVDDVHVNAIVRWPLLPGSIRRLFIQTFGAGLRRPDDRVRESQWRTALEDLHDSVVRCAQCAAENFVDIESATNTCWSCGRVVDVVARLTVGRSNVALSLGSRLLDRHVGASRGGDAVAVAEVVAHPSRADVIGLRNDSRVAWTATTSSGAVKTVAPGHTIAVGPGLVIDFGQTEGRVIDARP